MIDRLSKAELRILTGTSHRARQFAWCLANKIPATEDTHGSPVVLRAAVEARLMPGAGPRPAVRTGPDLEALRPRSRVA